MLEKINNYFSNIRWDIINLIPAGKNKILEIGCGTGNTGKVLKEQGKALEVIGIEKIPQAAESAKKNLNSVITADIETVEMPFDKGYFDYIIAADILEHLYNPWLTISNLKKYIKKDGFIITSIPNIRHWRIVRELILKGNWTYNNAGLLDDTHIRFFTKKTMMKMIQSAGFTINLIIPKFKLEPANRYNILNNLTLHLLEEFWAQQYIIMARKND
ncbi:MAG: class I SAM-dependent methyltransferase [Phycisphaerae bacterium]|nr:class I SAM-dependent methyltransferase [Phycisphaerae bacterium]MDD5381524.1 class I SAM-dependent methyltransferase [Phycisphaerae bacterium]